MVGPREYRVPVSVPAKLEGAMHYLLTPLDKHYDRGFGAVANSFMEAADDLREAAGKGAF